MLSIADNPPALTPDVRSLTELNGEWWIAHTKAKHERQLVRHLLGCGVGYYLPLLERVSISSGKKRWSMTPMFPGYVFFCGDVEAKYAAFSSGCLCQVIDVKEQGRLVGELREIERAIAGHATLELYRFAAVGRRCRVTGGPLAGVEGVVVRWAPRSRLVLQVSMLGHGASLEIEADLLEPVE